MSWDYPVYVSEAELALEKSTASTVAQSVRKALPRAESFAWIAGDDLRPLLVLRECLSCNGTDYALLNRSEDNERTLLMARWFHCVKLPTDVTEEDHPFAAMFPDNKPPHLFVCSPDGSNMQSLSGEQSRKELWDAMEDTLKLEYTRNAKKTVRELLKVLVTYDTLDGMEDWRVEQLEAALEKDGAKSRKAAKIRKQIAKLRTDKAEAKAKEAKLSDLGLKRKPVPEKVEETDKIATS